MVSSDDEDDEEVEETPYVSPTTRKRGNVAADARLAAGAAVRRKFHGYGQTLWDGRVDRVGDADFVVTWAGDGSETTHRINDAPAMLDLAEAPAKAKPAPPDTAGLVVGAPVKKKFRGYGAQLWSGEVTAVDEAAGTFDTLWEDGEELTHDAKDARAMLDAAAAPPPKKKPAAKPAAAKPAAAKPAAKPAAAKPRAAKKPAKKCEYMYDAPPEPEPEPRAYDYSSRAGRPRARAPPPGGKRKRTEPRPGEMPALKIQTMPHELGDDGIPAHWKELSMCACIYCMRARGFQPAFIKE